MPNGMTVYTCRRQPPTGNAIILWPVTKHDDWCGEWRARQADAMTLDELRAAGANLTQWEREP